MGTHRIKTFIALLFCLQCFGHLSAQNKKRFQDAAVAFRRAVQLDPSYAYPHYNLSCMLSLLLGQGQQINPGELIYHLQYAILLRPNYRTKLKTDTDLDPVRNESFFKNYLRLLDEGHMILKNKNLYIQTQSQQSFITELIEEVMEPLWITPRISESPDKKAAAFIAMYNKEPLQ